MGRVRSILQEVFLTGWVGSARIGLGGVSKSHGSGRVTLTRPDPGEETPGLRKAPQIRVCPCVDQWKIPKYR